MKLHLVFADETMHRVDGSRRGTETIAAMHKLHRGGERLKIDHPIKRAVATAGNQDLLAAEVFHFLDGIENGLAFIFLDAGNGRALGLEAAAARRDDDDPSMKDEPAICLHAPADRKSAVSGKCVSVRVDLGGHRIIKKKKI